MCSDDDVSGAAWEELSCKIEVQFVKENVPSYCSVRPCIEQKYNLNAFLLVLKER